jgi:hypothetical protein
MNRNVSGNRGQIRPLNLWIVKVVEIVENRNLMSSREQLLDKVRADKARSARDQNAHRATVKMKPSTSKGRTMVARAFQFPSPRVFAVTDRLK